MNNNLTGNGLKSNGEPLKKWQLVFKRPFISTTENDVIVTQNHDRKRWKEKNFDRRNDPQHKTNFSDC